MLSNETNDLRKVKGEKTEKQLHKYINKEKY